jgi:hypothetical protein
MPARTMSARYWGTCPCKNKKDVAEHRRMQEPVLMLAVT